jgi:hypothetical protein
LQRYFEETAIASHQKEFKFVDRFSFKVIKKENSAEQQEEFSSKFPTAPTKKQQEQHVRLIKFQSVSPK